MSTRVPKDKSVFCVQRKPVGQCEKSANGIPLNLTLWKNIVQLSLFSCCFSELVPKFIFFSVTLVLMSRDAWPSKPDPSLKLSDYGAQPLIWFLPRPSQNAHNTRNCQLFLFSQLCICPQLSISGKPGKRSVRRFRWEAMGLPPRVGLPLFIHTAGSWRVLGEKTWRRRKRLPG